VARPPEAAVINPTNPDVMSRHLICAAAELPLATGDPLLAPPAVQDCLKRLIADGTCI
jgi:DEAD/DEAH box helicase domain-containing protein